MHAETYIAKYIENSLTGQFILAHKTRCQREWVEVSDLKQEYTTKLNEDSNKLNETRVLKMKTKAAVHQCEQLATTIQSVKDGLAHSKENMTIATTLIEQKRMKFNKLYKEYVNVVHDLRLHTTNGKQ